MKIMEEMNIKIISFLCMANRYNVDEKTKFKSECETWNRNNIRLLNFRYIQIYP